MHIQRIRPSHISVLCFYLMLMNCKYYDRNEDLDKREENLLNYLESVSNFVVGFWHSKKELRKSARAVAKNGLDQIAGAKYRNDLLAVREYIKETMTAYLKLAFGNDFYELLENETEILIKVMGDKSYAEFAFESSNKIMIETVENEILVEGTKLNFIKY